MFDTIVSMYRGTSGCVRVGGECSGSFEMQTGVRQGSVLSPLLFNLFMEGLADRLRAAGVGVRLGTAYLLSCLLFADDVALVAESVSDLSRLIVTAQAWVSDVGSSVNISKSGVVL